MTGAIECRYYGRDFTADEMALLRALIAANPQPTRAALSREFCRRIGWLKPDGGLKDMMARVTMLAMHRDGVIVLPAPKGPKHRPRPIAFGPDTEPPLFPAPTTLDEVRPLQMCTVVRETREGRLWNEFVARYHLLFRRLSEDGFPGLFRVIGTWISHIGSSLPDREETGGGRTAVGASSRCAAPSLRYGPSGDPPPSVRRSASMAVSAAFGHGPIARRIVVAGA